MRFGASKTGKQNLVISYAPNPVSEGKMTVNGNNELLWNALLDNNNMQYAVRIKAINKGGSISNDGGRLIVKNADEVLILLTADTD